VHIRTAHWTRYETQVGGATSTPPPVTAIVFQELGAEARFAAWHAAQMFVRELSKQEFVGVYTLDTALHATVPFTREQRLLLDGLRKAAMHPGCPEVVAGTIENVEGTTGCPVGPGELAVKATLSGLRAIVQLLATRPGRKNVLLFSEGFRVSTAGSGIDVLQNLIAEANESGVSIQTIDARGLRTIDGRQEIRRRLSTYAGSETTTPGGLATKSEDPNELLALDPTIALARMAHETGGEFVSDTNDLEGALRKLSDRMEVYYKIGYRPTESSSRAFHKIALHVAAPDAVVLTRSGYYDERSRDRRVDALPPAAVAPVLVLESGASPRDIEMVSTLHYARDAVDVRAEVSADGLAFTTSEGRFDAGVTILARTLDGSGKVLQAVSETLELNGPAGQLTAARARTLSFNSALPVRNARTVEIVAYDVLGGRAAVERHDVKDR
jgi:VWFA-related protein